MKSSINYSEQVKRKLMDENMKIEDNPVKLKVIGILTDPIHNVYISRGEKTQIDVTRFEGKRFNVITLEAVLYRKSDVDDLITFLKIHKQCFEK